MMKLKDIPDSAKLCPQCDYDLSGQIISSNYQCPECGFEFELDLLVSQKYHWQRWRKDARMKLIVLVLIMILLIAAMSLLF